MKRVIKFFIYIVVLKFSFFSDVYGSDCLICTHKWAETATIEDVKTMFNSGVSPNGYIILGKAGDRVIKGGPILYFLTMRNPNDEVIKFYFDYSRRKNVEIPLVIYDSDGDMKYSALHSAAYNESLEINKLLVDLGADLSLTDDGYETPLHVAASNNENPEVIELYINKGAKVNVVDGSGWTPLHKAARFSRSASVVKKLIAYGANINVKSNNGWTPYSLAMKYSSNEIKEIFISEKN